MEYERYFVLLTLTCLLLIVGCKEENESVKLAISEGELKEKLLEANRKRVAIEKNKIDMAIINLGWDLIETGTGLRFQVYKSQNGDSLKLNDLIELSYVITYLNGDTIYSSAKEGSQFFTLGRDNIESGIHEVVSYLKVGDKAHVILPAHLAHGFMGDNQKIPSNTTLIYDLQILSVK